MYLFNSLSFGKVSYDIFSHLILGQILIYKWDGALEYLKQIMHSFNNLSF